MFYNTSFDTGESILEPALVSPEMPGKLNKPPMQPGALPPCRSTNTGFITKLPGENGGNIYQCIIDYFVKGVEPFYNLLDLLYQATAQDIIYLNIYSYGGQVETGCHIINAMLNTKAKTVTVAYGICASIGAMIWSCGQERRVTDNATIMYHMPSGGCFGKTADNEEMSHNVQIFFENFMRTVTKGILTDEQLNMIINRRIDMFIPGETMKRRLQELTTTEAQHD